MLETVRRLTLRFFRVLSTLIYVTSYCRAKMAAPRCRRSANLHILVEQIVIQDFAIMHSYLLSWRLLVSGSVSSHHRVVEL